MGTRGHQHLPAIVLAELDAAPAAEHRRGPIQRHCRPERAAVRDAHEFLHRCGFDKRKLIDCCAEKARLPAREYWDNQSIQTLLRPHAVAGIEPYASRLKAKPDELVQMFLPEDINIVVAGGETQGAWKIFGGSLRKNATVLVDAWR